jgi:serine/threonine protein kinase
VKIKNENVARVTDVGTLENGAPYMVMEFLDGWDLSSLLRTRGAMPIDEAVDFLLQACVAVADAHALGIIHRDLKPANLFCVRRSDGQLCIKVLDFGISKLTDVTGNRASAMSMTKTDTVMGSPVYMSPEQMRSSKAVDTRTDIWSLGVVLFELIARRVPFTADSLMELGAKIATDPPPPLGSFRHDIPPGLEGVIFKCLEKDPRRRHANIGELAAALLPFAPSRAKASVERISGIIASAGALRTGADPSRPSHPMLMSTETLPSLGRTTSGATRGRSIAIGTSVLGALVVGGVVAVGVLSKKSAREERLQPAAVSSAATVTPTVSVVVATTPPAVSARDAMVAPPATSGFPSPPWPEPRPVAVEAPPPALAASNGTSAVRPVKAPSGPPPAVPPPAVGKTASAPSGTPASAKPGCNPPFTIDPITNKKNWKIECFSQ